MTFYKFPTRYIPHVKLMSEEILCDGRPHDTRTLNETVIYILTEGCLNLESGGETVKMLWYNQLVEYIAAYIFFIEITAQKELL